MNAIQPEASTSTSPPPSKHYCSLVIDPGLPREQYLKLIEAEGVVHSLVQRLLEKHGGDKHLLFDAQVIPPVARQVSTTRLPNGFRQSSAFLASLPSLSRSLVAGGDASVIWPGFSDSINTNKGEMPWEASKFKHRRRETCLLNGIVEGIETLSHRPQRECARRFIHTITPPEAIPLLNKSFRTKTLDSHYLIILTGSSSTDSTGEEWRALPTTNMDQEWDEKSWREVGEGCMAKGIYASCVVAGREEDSELSRSLRILCQETSPNGFEEAWFDVPEDADVAISGFGIDPGTVPPSPSAPATSSAPTEQIITPATNPSEQLPNLNNNAAKMQYVQNQMAFFRNIQNRAAESGNPLNPQAVAQLMQAMKSGNVDMSSPGMQQIKSLLSLQQQQKSGQVAMNPGAAAALQAQIQQGNGSGGQGNANTDQLLMAAMRQQMLQQGQGQGQVNVGQQQQPQNQVQQQQQQQRPQTQTQTQPQGQQQNQRPNQNQIWSGNLIWTINSSTRLALNLNASAVGGSQASDYKGDLWPKDLVISTVTSCTIQDLQAYSRANRAPFALLIPSQVTGDTNNHQKYINMAKSLHAGGQMATVSLGGDRGLIIFAMLTNGEGRPERLMALVCVNSPLPPLRGQQTGDANINNHQRTQSSNSQPQQQVQAQSQSQSQSFQNGLAQPTTQTNSISPSFINPQAQVQQNQQLFQQQQQQQQYVQQQPQQPQRPAGQQQYMLTPEQTQIFRHLAAQHNLPLESNFDPFNLDENKYRQIMGLVTSASNKMAQARPAQQAQGLGMGMGQVQVGMQSQGQGHGQAGMQGMVDPSLDMMNFQQQQHQFGQQGQGGFQGVNLGGQYQ